MAKFGINQNENININMTLSKLDLVRAEMKLEKKNLLQDLKTDKTIVESLLKDDKDKIDGYLKNNYNLEDISKLIICDKSRNYVFGEKWELVDKYLSQIYLDISKEYSESFIGNYGSKLFQITYSPISSTDTNKELIGVLIIIENFHVSTLNLSSDSEVSLISYNGSISENNIPGNLLAYIDNINKLIEFMTEKKIVQTIKKLNIDNAAGIRIFYDLMNEPSGIFIISYNRYVNQFVQQGILIFVLILLAITLIMTSLLGNWFSKTILIPVKNISNNMQDISENPSELEPIEKNYSGVLGDMVDSFNTMNIALSKHSQILREYKELTDNLDTGIFWLNYKFEVILYNPSFKKIMEMNENQLLHRDLSKLMGIYEMEVEEIYKAPLTFSKLKIRPNGKLKYVAMNIRAIQHDASIKFYGSIIDVSKETLESDARKSLELELIKSNKLADIGKKIEGIVHNINSPLNTILGYAQLMKKDIGDNTDLDRIIEAGKNIAHNVKGLLTKVKQSNISIDRPININEMISQELEFCKHNLFFKHFVKLSTDFQKDLPNVTASYGDLSLCAANVINNAIQAMKDCIQKELSIRTYEEDDMVCVEITDTGEGIPENNLGNIFETYFSTKEGKSGTGFGLGLAITKSIIEKYNGVIKVDSKLDFGSTFKMIFHKTKG